MTDLRAQLSAVRKELSDLLFEQQQMLLVVGPNLEARFRALVGKYQTELQGLQLDNRRLKRALELCRASLQTQTHLDAPALKQQLDQELWEWRRRLSDEKDRQEAAEQRLKRLRSAETSAVLRSLYRQLVKRLHPDLHPGQGEAEQRLWFDTQQAYQWGDWARLETLLATADDYEVEQTEAELERLMRRRGELSQALQQMRGQFPFSLGDQLEDERWVQSQSASLKLEIVMERQRGQKLQAMLEEFGADLLG